MCMAPCFALANILFFFNRTIVLVRNLVMVQIIFDCRTLVRHGKVGVEYAGARMVCASYRRVAGSMPAYPAAAVRDYSQMAQEKMLPLQGAVFWGDI